MNGPLIAAGLTTDVLIMFSRKRSRRANQKKIAIFWNLKRRMMKRQKMTTSTFSISFTPSSTSNFIEWP